MFGLTTKQKLAENKKGYRTKRLDLVAETAEAVQKGAAYALVEGLYNLLPQKKQLQLDESIVFSGLNPIDKYYYDDGIRRMARAAIFLLRLKQALLKVPDVINQKDAAERIAAIRIGTGPDCAGGHGLKGELPGPDNKSLFKKFIDANRDVLTKAVMSLFDDFKTNGDSWKQKIDPTSQAIAAHTVAIQELNTGVQELNTGVQDLTSRLDTLEASFRELRGDFDKTKSRFAEDIRKLNIGAAATASRVALLKRRLDKQGRQIQSLTNEVRAKYNKLNGVLKQLGAKLQTAKAELAAADQSNAAAIARLKAEYDGLVGSVLEIKKTAAAGLASCWLAIDLMKIQGTFTSRVFGADARLKNLSSALKQGYANYQSGLVDANAEAKLILDCIDGSLKAIAGVTPPPFKVIVDFARTMRSRVVSLTDLGDTSESLSFQSGSVAESNSVESNMGDSDTSGGGSSEPGQTVDSGFDGVPLNYDALTAKLREEGERVKGKISQLAKKKFGEFSAVKIGWQKVDLDIQAIQTRFTDARDQMVTDGNALIEHAMVRLIDRKLVAQCIESAMGDEGAGKKAEEIAEEVYGIVKKPFEDFFSKWAPSDAAITVWSEAGREACADAYEIMFFGKSFEANEKKRTSVVEIPASIIRRFECLGFVVQQISIPVASEAPDEQDEETFADSLEQTQGRTAGQIFTHGGMKGFERRTRAAAKGIAQGFSGVAGSIAGGAKSGFDSVKQGVNNIASRVLRSQKPSAAFYAEGHVPWRQGVQGNNANHALVLKLACMNFMRDFGGDPATRGAEFEMVGNPWDSVVKDGRVPLDEPIRYWGNAVEQAKKGYGSVAGGRRVSEEMRLRMLAEAQTNGDEDAG